MTLETNIKLEPEVDYVSISKSVLSLIEARTEEYNKAAKFKIKTVTAKKVFNSEATIIDGVCALNKFLNDKNEFKIVFSADLRQIFSNEDVSLATIQLKEAGIDGQILMEDLYLEQDKNSKFIGFNL